jgi:hypothetical protein
MEDIAANSTEERILKLLEKQSKKDDVPAAIVWLDSLLPTIITISTFGGSITFTLVLTEPQEPTTPHFTQDLVILYLTLAWLFFLLALSFAAVATLLLAAARDNIIEAIQPQNDNESMRRQWNTAPKWVLGTLSLLSLLLQVFTLLAFLFLSMVVFAYSRVVGAVAVGTTSFFMVFTSIFWHIKVIIYVRRRIKGVDRNAVASVSEGSTRA